MAAILVTSMLLVILGTAALASGDATSRFAVRPVVDVTSPPCQEGDLAGSGSLSDSCFSLGSSDVDADDVRSVSAVEQEVDGWMVVLRLRRDARSAWNDFLASNLSETVAVVVGGNVATTPTVQSPAGSKTLVIVSDFDRRTALSLARTIQPSGRIQTQALSPDERKHARLTDRAQAVCDRYLPDVGPNAVVSTVSPTTAGNIAKSAERVEARCSRLGCLSDEPFRGLVLVRHERDTRWWAGGLHGIE